MSLFGGSYPAGCSSTPYDFDYPETCPCCGGANFDEDAGVELYKPDPAFCSKACVDAWTEAERANANAYAADAAEEDRIVNAWLAREQADADAAMALYRATVAS